MTYGYEEALARRVAGTSTPSLSGGSGYFAARSETLDPSLFEYGDHLRPEVRRHIETIVHLFWEHRGYVGMTKCTRLWIAGSGITTAWNADREANGAPGDLDVLIGMHYSLFTSYNPQFQGSSPQAIAQFLNKEMHDGLWPATARTPINSGLYELTYYINDGVGDGHNDLLAISPYAAYDVTADEWTLHPVQVPEGFSPDYFSSSDRAVVADDLSRARQHLASFRNLKHLIDGTNHPDQINLLHLVHDVVRAGADDFDRIHDGRRAAFQGQGKGYFDPANYRWQAAKGNGAITVLRAFKQLDEEAHKDIARPCDDTQHLLLLGALANGR